MALQHVRVVDGQRQEDRLSDAEEVRQSTAKSLLNESRAIGSGSDDRHMAQPATRTHRADDVGGQRADEVQVVEKSDERGRSEAAGQSLVGGTAMETGDRMPIYENTKLGRSASGCPLTQMMAELELEDGRGAGLALVEELEWAMELESVERPSKAAQKSWKIDNCQGTAPSANRQTFE